MTRNELYELVWSQPMGLVADQLGLTDRALAGICRRALIPTPKRGHWRRVQTGFTGQKPTLGGDEGTSVVMPAAGGRNERKTRLGQRGSVAAEGWPFAIQKSRLEGDEFMPSCDEAKRRPDSIESDLALALGYAAVLAKTNELGNLLSSISERLAELDRERAARVLAWLKRVRAASAGIDSVDAVIESILRQG